MRLKIVIVACLYASSALAQDTYKYSAGFNKNGKEVFVSMTLNEKLRFDMGKWSPESILNNILLRCGNGLADKGRIRALKVNDSALYIEVDWDTGVFKNQSSGASFGSSGDGTCTVRY